MCNEEVEAAYEDPETHLHAQIQWNEAMLWYRKGWMHCGTLYLSDHYRGHGYVEIFPKGTTPPLNNPRDFSNHDQSKDARG